MIKIIDLLQQLLFLSIILSTITCTFIQKTKGLLNSNKYLILYSLIVNLLFGVIFCITFTKISFIHSFWVGLFSFIGADTIYKALEGKISTYTEIRNKRKNYPQ